MTHRDGAILRCTHCGADKPRDAFGTRPSGRPHSWCRACKRAHDRKMRPRSKIGRLRDALDAARQYVARELDASLQSYCVIKNGEPDRSTLDDEDREVVEEQEELLERIDAALAQ